MIVYVASPYSHKDKNVEEQRYQDVMRYCARQLQNGLRVFSPIVYAHTMAKLYELPTDAKWWQNFNEDFMRRCDVLYILHMPGWETSGGVKMEIEFASDNRITTVNVVNPANWEA